MLLGHDALGHWSLGHPPDSGATTTTLTAAAGALTIVGVAVSFTITEAISAASISISGTATPFKITEAVAPGAISLAGKPITFTITEALAAGSFTINGQPVNEIILEAETAAAIRIIGNDAQLVRTGFDYDVQQGGIGHYLLEAEEAKRLAAITNRPPPGFLDTRTPPTAALIGPRPAPVAPSVDLGALRAQAEAHAAQKAAKQRRDIEAILLLAA